MNREIQNYIAWANHILILTNIFHCSGVTLPYYYYKRIFIFHNIMRIEIIFLICIKWVVSSTERWAVLCEQRNEFYATKDETKKQERQIKL
jgi:hypothetical protein